MNNKQVQQAVMRRFNDDHAAETRTPFLRAAAPAVPHEGLLSNPEALPRHLDHFFKVAVHRKRQFLEKMLLDS